MVTLQDLRDNALTLLQDVEDGQPLPEQTSILIKLGISASVTSLNTDAIAAATDEALAAGVTADQLQEIMALVSGLGVHTFMEGSTILTDAITRHGDARMSSPMSEQQKMLWDKYVGSDNYWDEVNKEMPGFLASLLRLSPAAFEGFFSYCAIPWKSGHVDARSKELISMACDATPTHRYLPGMRLHLKNALKLGAGRQAIMEALDIAASGPEHVGIIR